MTDRPNVRALALVVVFVGYCSFTAFLYWRSPFSPMGATIAAVGMLGLGVVTVGGIRSIRRGR